MQRSIFLARLTGPLLTLVGIDMLIGPTGFLAVISAIMDDPALVYIVSILGFLAGLSMLLAHNRWVPDWPIIFTVLGWLVLFDSSLWLLAPDHMIAFWRPATELCGLPLAFGALALLLGAALCYLGFFMLPPPPPEDAAEG
ncbi:hypothetical protein V6C03_00475 [Methyloligella sp. 2.7D]|uniref:hypothetical protein n=1 Tax=unclassified Methyloligella TaxID=2625955 RepID=UPI00157CA18E|nr:hypothetical protein [Methyloligella sp. GL2]QKP76853.1 hypothetical protein HT051_04940 [Methyloligella sp. GL2]